MTTGRAPPEVNGFDLDHLEKGEGWPEYAKGVARALQGDGFVLRGWEGVTLCDVPLGAGLSSSASFELAVARAFASISGFAWEPRPMASSNQPTTNAGASAKKHPLISAQPICGMSH